MLDSRRWEVELSDSSTVGTYGTMPGERVALQALPSWEPRTGVGRATTARYLRQGDGPRDPSRQFPGKAALTAIDLFLIQDP